MVFATIDGSEEGESQMNGATPFFVLLQLSQVVEKQLLVSRNASPSSRIPLDGPRTATHGQMPPLAVIALNSLSI
jgi:hypothetical protein